jgi:hypothetical protein
MARPRAPFAPPVALALALAAAVLLVGCGGDDTFRTDRPALRLTLDEYRIAPQDVTVERKRLKIVARNTGILTHNLIVQIPQTERGERPVELARTKTAQPGETVEVKIDEEDLAPGSYELICSISNHDDLGQFGRLTVVG